MTGTLSPFRTEIATVSLVEPTGTYIQSEKHVSATISDLIDAVDHST
jgi:hypothetical protein